MLALNNTQCCIFLGQEVREKRAAVMFASPGLFPLSVRATARRKFWIFTPKFTPLSSSWNINVLMWEIERKITSFWRYRWPAVLCWRLFIATLYHQESQMWITHYSGLGKVGVRPRPILQPHSSILRAWLCLGTEISSAWHLNLAVKLSPIHREVQKHSCQVFGLAGWNIAP